MLESNAPIYANAHTGRRYLVKTNKKLKRSLKQVLVTTLRCYLKGGIDLKMMMGEVRAVQLLMRVTIMQGLRKTFMRDYAGY